MNPKFLNFALEVIKQNDENHKIALLIETDGLLVTEEVASKIAEAASAKNAEINWIVYLDSVEKPMYAKIHNCDESDFEKALASDMNAGNILSDGIENVWAKFGEILKNHLQFVDEINSKGADESQYCEPKEKSADNKCVICDESYTFNF